MTPDRLKELMTMSGTDRSTLSRLLGYASENSLRQAEIGDATLPASKAAWLERYAQFRSEQIAALDAWLQKNPPPRR